MVHPLTSPDSPPSDDLLGRLVAEMTAAWARGERPLAEDFLARYPHLWDEPEAAADLIYEEVCLRQQHGEGLGTEAVLARFPQWRAQLEVMLDCQRLLDAEGPPRFPAVGERQGEFQLLAELGRGGGGVVFLARQPALADRPVVLKLTPTSGREHLRLACLQHTHIVPLYSIEDDSGRRLRALCMPYFGGTSLSRLLAALAQQPPGRRTGKDLLGALDAAQSGSPVRLSPRGPARHLLERGSYVQAICWIGSCLAGALQYAHERGLVHLDLKPSNVLLTADGLPMLLDFHLARAPLTAGDRAGEGVGGTPGYLSPEQQQALAAVLAGVPVPGGVDARSDIYSLGVLLYEALGGPLPLSPGAVQRLRQANPEVSTGLGDILSRCLAARPEDRYPDAATLAADLQRHLQDLPLRGVSNRSLAERWRKWRRRQPHTLTLSLALCAVLAVAVAGLAGHLRQRADQGRVALAEGKAQMEQHRYAEAERAAAQGLRQVESVPFHGDLAAALRELRDHAEQERADQERDRSSAELHALAEQVRLLSGAESLPPARRRALEASCRTFWERRAQILARLGDSPRRASVRRDLLDLALFWADLRVSLASAGGKDAARREALGVLDEAEKLFGPSAALYHRREVHAAAAGLTDMARESARRRASLAPRSAWDHVTLGRSLLAGGSSRAAAAHFEKALALEPDNLWPHFYRGLCCFRLGEHQEAVTAFSVCVGLAPREARCYYNRGCAYAGWGQADKALADYDRALELEPALGVAALNRGRLRLQRKDFDGALADLERALAGGVEPAVAYCDRARVKLARGDREGARAELRRALEHDPACAEAIELRDRLKKR
jgi:serine/threonine protein kinase/Flp pilus assembly protein TadD